MTMSLESKNCTNYQLYLQFKLWNLPNGQLKKLETDIKKQNKQWITQFIWENNGGSTWFWQWPWLRCIESLETICDEDYFINDADGIDTMHHHSGSVGCGWQHRGLCGQNCGEHSGSIDSRHCES